MLKMNAFRVSLGLLPSHWDSKRPILQKLGCLMYATLIFRKPNLYESNCIVSAYLGIPNHMIIFSKWIITNSKQKWSGFLALKSDRFRLESNFQEPLEWVDHTKYLCTLKLPCLWIVVQVMACAAVHLVMSFPDFLVQTHVWIPKWGRVRGITEAYALSGSFKFSP